MRYCYNCGWVTVGQPRFCNRCGKSYDAKLCPRLHPNSRQSEVCSECGSRDLTTPQPKMPFWLRLLLPLLSVVPGIILLLLSVAYLFAYGYDLFFRPGLPLPVLFLGLALGGLWLLYMELPGFVRGKVRAVKRKG